MKIAFVSTILGYPWGGADTLWTHAAEAAAQRGDRLFLSVSPLLVTHPRLQALQAAGASLFVRQPPQLPSLLARLRRKCGWDIDTEAALNNAIARFRPDLVIVSQGGTYDLLLHPQLVDWLRSTRTPFRVIANWQQEHPSLSDADRAFVRDALSAAERVFFVSQRNLAVTRRHLLHPLPNARVIHNPLRWQPADTSPWPAQDTAQLATVSRLEENKGVHLLLHALAELGSDAPPWHLTIFGRGPAEFSLRTTCDALGIANRVGFAGYVPQLRPIWERQHLMCSPAIDDGVPMTIPEAMLCARPVLSTCVGGAEDWVRDGATGFLCPAPTVPLLVSTLQRAFAARDQWPAIGKAAAESARAFYRPDDFRLLLA